jgi:choline dehydrogenase-like flavoprotein
VLGSGPSGAMAAYQLICSGLRVTMLEAGTIEPQGMLVRVGGRNVFRRSAPLDFEEHFKATGDPDTRWVRTLQPGGLTNQWTGAVPRFAPSDFHEGEAIHERYRWPIEYEDLVPHYETAERLLTITGPGQDFAQLPGGVVYKRRRLPSDWGPVSDAARGRGQALVAMPLADGPSWLVAQRGQAFNSYSNIVRRLLGNPLFSWRPGCVALRLVWCGRRRRISSVLYHDRGDSLEHRIEGRAFVVACGPLRSTKLMFDSACADFPDGIGNTSGNLGRFLHDHPKEWWTVRLERPISRMSPAAYLTRRPFADSEPLISNSWTLGVASARDKVLSLLPGKSDALGVQLFGSMIPTCENFVAPHPSLQDEFGLPQLEINMRFSPAALANMSAAREWFVEMMDEAGYPCVLDPVEPQLAPGGSAHFGGTARMHSRPEYGVVDSRGRVFDVPNLVVADASTFTTSSEKNPTLTAMALASRAAEWLAHDLRR